MPKFEFDYDSMNDSLFVFKKGAKSKASIELGNFIYDFDALHQIAGIEILSATDTLAELVNHEVSKELLKSIKSTDVKTRIISNLLMIRIQLAFNSKVFDKELIVPIQVPNIEAHSHATS